MTDEERETIAWLIREKEALKWVVRVHRTVVAMQGIGGFTKGLGGWLLAMSAVVVLGREAIEYFT